MTFYAKVWITDNQISDVLTSSEPFNKYEQNYDRKGTHIEFTFIVHNNPTTSKNFLDNVSWDGQEVTSSYFNLEKVIQSYQDNYKWRYDCEVTIMQAKLSLFDHGYLVLAESLIDLKGPRVKVMWENTATLKRMSSLVRELGTSLSLSEEDLDDLFLYASQINEM